MSVGLVLVSHSARLAEGLRELTAQMAPDVAVVAAGGMEDGEVGTSFDLVLAAVAEADGGDGAVLLYDLGSALMTADLVLEVLDDDQRQRVRVADAPLVEGALAAATTAQGGASVEAVAAAATSAWRRVAEGPAPADAAAEVATSADGAESAEPADDAVREVATLANSLGIHARPAAMIVKEVSGYDAEVLLGPPGEATADARSILSVVALGITGGQQMEVVGRGAQAREAVDAVVAMARDGFGEE
ncbi:MAG TPA: dihydroxyacetone kinase phosphoryl donor subunit DhaM [Jiangellales bacterium]|nr:dihydroxyacetone kinase phosphoryl donor subunit DhaM [Jiangellales bacterium]